MRRTMNHVAAAAVFAAAGCSSSLFEPAPPVAYPEVRVAMRFGGGLPLVEATLPGDAHAWFLIDTGVGNFTLLSEERSRALKLKHDVVHDPLLPSMQFQAELERLEIDGLGRRKVRVYVTDALTGRDELSDLGVPVEGVVGTGFFRDHCLFFDWRKGEFTATFARNRQPRQIPIPLRIGIAGDLHATVRLNGKTAEALIDTGSAETLVAQEFADSIGLRYDHGKVAVTMETSIGTAATRDGEIDLLTLGSEQLAKVPATIVERRLPNADLVLGTELLSRYGVILDLGTPPYLVLDPVEGGLVPDSAPKQ